MSVPAPSDCLTLHDAIQEFLTTKQLEQRSPVTIQLYSYDLAPFETLHGPDIILTSLTPAHIRQYLILSQQRPGPYSHHSRYRTLRTFLNWCVAEHYIPSSPLTIGPPRLPRRVIPTFTQAQIRAILNACSGSTARRDRAMILTLLDSGIRLSELATMRLTDIDWDTGHLTVIGKGDKQRTVTLSRPTLLAVFRYLRHRNSPLAHLWLSEERKPLTTSGIQQVVQRRTKEALGKTYGPHRFRHTYACAFLDAGGDLSALQEILGHASPRMTLHYAAATKAQRALDQSKRFSPVQRLQL